MRRRRRPDKEIHFSFDSFLDVVANVVGIIIKLILVAWVGSRTYKGFEIPESFTPNTQNITENKLVDVSDPLTQSIIEKNKNKTNFEALLTSKKNDLNEQEKEKGGMQQKVYELNSSLKAILDQEKALMPATQPLVEEKIAKEHMRQQIRDLDLFIDDLYNQRRELERQLQYGIKSEKEEIK